MHKLATQMRNCHTTLNNWCYEDHLNNHDTINIIFLRLLLSHQREFQKKTVLLFAAGKEPDFKCLMEFVQNHAMFSKTRFRQVLRTPKNSDSTLTGRSTQNFNVNLSRKKLPSKHAVAGQKERAPIAVNRHG